jgi:hypothetical protein
MVTIQEHLLSFQKYTEDDVIYWMGVQPGTKLWYVTEFGDGATIIAEFVELKMSDKIPIIICSSFDNVLHWGYFSQYKKCQRKL